eukprot:3088017-Prymnesium_polylepis.1
MMPRSKTSGSVTALRRRRSMRNVLVSGSSLRGGSNETALSLAAHKLRTCRTSSDESQYTKAPAESAQELVTVVPGLRGDNCVSASHRSEGSWRHSDRLKTPTQGPLRRRLN